MRTLPQPNSCCHAAPQRTPRSATVYSALAWRATSPSRVTLAAIPHCCMTSPHAVVVQPTSHSPSLTARGRAQTLSSMAVSMRAALRALTTTSVRSPLTAVPTRQPLLALVSGGALDGMQPHPPPPDAYIVEGGCLGMRMDATGSVTRSVNVASVAARNSRCESFWVRCCWGWVPSHHVHWGRVLCHAVCVSVCGGCSQATSSLHTSVPCSSLSQKGFTPPASSAAVNGGHMRVFMQSPGVRGRQTLTKP
jgi:hypothetical protein